MQDDDEGMELLRGTARSSTKDICLAVLGEPTQRTSTEWRYGKRGSISVMVAGPKRGQWFDHETGEGGDMLALIRRVRGGTFPEVVRWARGFLGLGEDDSLPPAQSRTRSARELERERKRAQERAAAEAEDTTRRERAQRYWREAAAIEPGSAADRYLTEARKIPRPAMGWPAVLRFHSGRCALVVAATTATGEVAAVQLIHLTPEGRKREAEEGRPVKQSFGPQEGAVVRLPGDHTVLQLAEGPETGLTAWAATGCETWIALGSIAKVEPAPLRRLLIVADDDPRDAPAAKALRKAVIRWRDEAREVAVALPWPSRRYDKSDLNDLAQREGMDAVRARIAAALNPLGPKPPSKRLPAHVARRKLAEVVERFFREARDFDPDDDEGPAPIVHAVKVDVGVGKSEAARREAARLLAELRARGDRRNVAILVPTHALGEEQARAFEALHEAQAAGLRATGCGVARTRGVRPGLSAANCPNVPGSGGREGRPGGWHERGRDGLPRSEDGGEVPAVRRLRIPAPAETGSRSMDRRA
jgi:putative DNA primase/helicase